MNRFLGLGFGLVATATMLALSTTCADAAKRHVGNAPRFATHDFFEPSLYWMYRLCSPTALAADPYTVCFPVHAVRPVMGVELPIPLEVNVPLISTERKDIADLRTDADDAGFERAARGWSGVLMAANAPQ